jgi:hypothetical protein
MLTPDQLVSASCALTLAARWLDAFERSILPLIGALPEATVAESVARYEEVWGE